MKTELIANNGSYLTQNDDRTENRVFAKRVWQDDPDNWRDATALEIEAYETELAELKEEQDQDEV